MDSPNSASSGSGQMKAANDFPSCSQATMPPVQELPPFQRHPTTPMPLEPAGHVIPRPLPVAPTHAQMPPPLILPHGGLWPSMLSGQPLLSHSTSVLPSEPLQAPPSASTPFGLPPTSAQTTPRRKLTDDERRQMCIEAEKNSNMKQTQIAAKFNVKRSTVSKILRQRDKYMNPPATVDIDTLKKKFNAKLPDFEKSLSNWVKNQRRKSLLTTDEDLLKQAQIFSFSRSDQAVVSNSTWLENFKLKNHLCPQTGDSESALANWSVTPGKETAVSGAQASSKRGLDSPPVSSLDVDTADRSIPVNVQRVPFSTAVVHASSTASGNRTSRSVFEGLNLRGEPAGSLLVESPRTLLDPDETLAVSDLISNEYEFITNDIAKSDQPKVQQSDVIVVAEPPNCSPSSPEGGKPVVRQNWNDAADEDDEDDKGSADTDSFWMSDYSESTPRLDEENALSQLDRRPIVEYMLSAFRQQYHEHVNNSQRSNTNATLPKNSGEATEGQHHGSKRSQKRRRCPDDEERDQDEADDLRKKLRPLQFVKKGSLSLACPFSKKDPLQYRTCYKNRLTKISYVKQHLSRHHHIPIYCPICMETFSTEGDRDIHTRARSCEERALCQWEGVSEAQKTLLKRKVPQGMSEQEQWYVIFEILFPGVPHPQSPYVDSELSEELLAFRDFASNKGPAILMSHLRGENVSSEIMVEDPEFVAFQHAVLSDGIEVIFEQFAEAKLMRRLSSGGPETLLTSESLASSQDRLSSTESTVVIVEAHHAMDFSPQVAAHVPISNESQNTPPPIQRDLSKYGNEWLGKDWTDPVAGLDHQFLPELLPSYATGFFPENIELMESLDDGLFNSFSANQG